MPGLSAVPSATRPPRTLVAVLPFLLAALTLTALFLSVRDRLPEPMATHFSDGRADGFNSVALYLPVCLGLLLVFAAVFAVLAPRTVTARDGRALNGVGYGMAALSGVLSGATLLCNVGVRDAADARLPYGQLAIAFGAALLAAGVGLLLPTGAAPGKRAASGDLAAPGPDRARLPLAEGEAVGWSRSVRAPFLAVLSCVFLAGGLVAGLTVDWGLGGGLLFAGLTAGLCSEARATVDRQGLTVEPILFPRPRIRFPLDRLVDATSRTVSPLADFGGWGYRVRPGRSGVVLRSGEALVVRRADGGEFVVTVDDAATAAALLNALIDRAHRRNEG
ncbi:DUF1648 domain-containing protein [Streptomyces sp. MST-110588]|uniref:DUF1648 domain-containing protein n=1 Tax=Streptomyces sp. MST-110588 TaxID=2833628 RepID=UPI001F5D4E12|nr:DUF1648 domain-containing protein [Streptomyces sp. MST-110588]UNO39474.1 DUF1648 domain-containing protein [Streptomyces sp. MST-110588]